MITEEEYKIFEEWYKVNYKRFQESLNKPLSELATEDIVLAAIRLDPVLFAELICKKTLFPWQQQFLNSVKTNDKVSVRSGTGVGKTLAAAILCLWFLILHKPSKVSVISASEGQLKAGLWNEIHFVMSDSSPWLMKNYTFTKEKIYLTEAESKASITLRVANVDRTTTLQGIHADNNLVVIDEASEIDNTIFAAFDGIFADKHPRMAVLGNPDNVNGKFHQIHTTDNDWIKLHVPADPDVIPSHASAKLRDHMLAEHGIDSDFYRIKILGEFPLGDNTALIQQQWMEYPLQGLAQETYGVVVWGLDIALSKNRDRTCLAKRQGNTLLEPIKIWQTDIVSVHVNKLLDEYRAAAEKPIHICVDSTGPFAAGVVQALADAGLPVIGIDSRGKPTVPDRYKTMKAEIWYRCMEWFKSGNKKFKYSSDSNRAFEHAAYCDLANELVMPKTNLKNGLLVMETKDEFRKRYKGKSPDLADAFVLTFGVEEINRVAIDFRELAGVSEMYDPLNDYY